MVWWKWNLRYFPSYNLHNLDISRELVFIEKIYYIHYADNGQSLYGGSGVRLPRLAFCFSPSCRPCSALPNSSSIVVSHQSSYKSHVSLGSWNCFCLFHIFEGLHVSWCFSFLILEDHPLSWCLLGYTTEFSVYFLSVIVMFLFSVLF